MLAPTVQFDASTWDVARRPAAQVNVFIERLFALRFRRWASLESLV